MVSERTKQVKKYRNIFGLLSVLCWVGVAIAVIIVVMTKLGANNNIADEGEALVQIGFSQSLKDKAVALGVTTAIILISAIFIKEKVRTTIYLFSILLMRICIGEVGAYIVLGVFALDEYIFHPLYKHFSNKVTINKEIDLR